MKSKKQKAKDKKQKTEDWVKAVFGIFLLVFHLINKKKPLENKKKWTTDENQIKEKEAALLNKDKLMKKNTDTNKDSDIDEEKQKEREGWLKAQPEELPSPTYWPFFLALGLVFLFWGIITSWVILLVGLLLFIIALAGWINILRHEK